MGGTDSNADKRRLGNDSKLPHCATEQVDVHAHDKSVKQLQNVPVVLGATAWDNPVAGDTITLTTNEALHCGGESDHSLINPKTKCKTLGLPFGKIHLTKKKAFPLDQSSLVFKHHCQLLMGTKCNSCPVHQHPTSC